MKKLTLFIAVSCLLIISCQSVKTERVYIVPDIDFPQFPALEREIHADGSWTIPKESIDMLAEYYIEIQKTEADYNGIKRLYEKENKQ